MANDTWAEIEPAARILARDNPTTTANRCTSSADALIITNRIYRVLYSLYEPRMTIVSGVSSGWTVAADGVGTTSTPVNWARVMNVVRVTDNSLSDGPNQLEILTQEQFNARKSRETRTQAPPEYCSLMRLSSLSAGSQGKWYLRVGPPADTTYYFPAHVEVEATDLSVAGSAPELPPAGSSLLIHLLAYHLALLAGQSADYCGAILAMAPDQKRAAQYLGIEKEGLQGRHSVGRLG